MYSGWVWGWLGGGGGGFLFQAEDGIRDLVRSRGLGDVYKRQQWGTFSKESMNWLLGEKFMSSLVVRPVKRIP